MSYFRLIISTKELFFWGFNQSSQPPKELFFWDGKNRQSALPEKFFF